jgi:hypothetical protein
MKRIQEVCAAMMLLFVLTGSALAGHITTDAVPPPPPPPASATATAPGHITTDATSTGTENVIESEPLLTELTLSLLQLLSVF